LFLIVGLVDYFVMRHLFDVNLLIISFFFNGANYFLVSPMTCWFCSYAFLG